MSQDPPKGKRGPGRPRHPVKRETLLDVATELFAQSGFAGTSMNDIATRVGLRKSSLFHHFDTKNKLYREVLIGIVDSLATKVQEAAAFEGSYRERLDHLTDSVADYLARQPWSAVLVVRESVDGQLFAEGDVVAKVGAAIFRVAQFLEAGMKDRIFMRTDPRRLAFSIASMHFLYFAAPDVVSQFLGEDIMTEDAVSEHKQVLAGQIRRLCGLMDD